MIQKFLICSIILTSTLSAFASTSLEISDLTCTATNVAGISRMQYDPKTKDLQAVTNGFLKSNIHKVMLVSSDSSLRSGKKISVVIGYLSYKDWIGELRTPHVTLEFNTLLTKPGTYDVTGFLFQRDYGKLPLANVSCRIKLQNSLF